VANSQRQERTAVGGPRNQGVTQGTLGLAVLVQSRAAMTATKALLQFSATVALQIPIAHIPSSCTSHRAERTVRGGSGSRRPPRQSKGLPARIGVRCHASPAVCAGGAQRGWRSPSNTGSKGPALDLPWVRGKVVRRRQVGSTPPRHVVDQRCRKGTPVLNPAGKASTTSSTRVASTWTIEKLVAAVD